MHTILLVEDEQDIRDLLVFSLKQEGFTVYEGASGEEGLVLAEKYVPDVVLLDVMLPGIDGFTVCRELASRQKTRGIPVIMLTARGKEVDRVVGFELGAVDYVVKPFSLREVVLRIRAALRYKSAPAREGGQLRAGGIMMDTQSHEVSVAGKSVGLTLTEFSILHDLMAHKGIVRSREQILAKVWGESFDGYTRTVDVHVKKLREKLMGGADLLETIRGIGYRIKEGRNG